MDKPTPYCSPEIWGGLECTINRVGNEYIDQLEESGHYYRDEDIAVLASTGIRKIRYPILWERHCPAEDSVIDWSWISSRLEMIRGHEIEVIAGLVHHGSGPSFTDLSDPQWPYRLAAYAGQVAERFPWIKYYTPVNEPLTTARFSGLYGIWYPHKRDTKSFLRMLVHELKGVVLSMQAIRAVNPDAHLVQTEDLGKTYSTPLLKYQADFENERRWLTYDLLCGMVNEQHPLYNHLLVNGILPEDLSFFHQNPCVPDVFGFNHYITSERYLDENLNRYPEEIHGGNGKHRYADVEAARVPVNAPTGLEVLLREAWQRYQKPMVITEVHLHCHREEQLRWFRHVYSITKKLNEDGIPLPAITSWAMLGSYGWNRLLTRKGGTYEPGVFDLRGGLPRPTALASFIETVASGEACIHRLEEENGWWQRASRLLYHDCAKTVKMRNNKKSPLLIIGKTGTLARAFARVCEDRNIPYQVIGRQDCDISDHLSVQECISRIKPWAVINAAGYVRVDDAENDREACKRANTDGPINLAIACAVEGVRLVNFSSDLVFDGNKPTPYLESDLPNPLNVYGHTKAMMELGMIRHASNALVIRTSAFFSPWDEYNFVHFVRRSLSQFQHVPVARDLLVSPTYVPHLVHNSLDLLIDGESGIWHLANKGAMSWAEWAFLIADRFGLNRSLIQPLRSDQMNYRARRPFNSVLGTERGQLLPDFSVAFDELVSLEPIRKRIVA